MSKQNKIIGLSFILITVFIISFYNLYQSVKIEQNILDITHHIHTSRIQNFLIKEQVSNDFKKQNYDQLNYLIETFSSYWDELSKEIKIKFMNQKHIISSIVDLDKSIEQLNLLYSRYESDKAVLANSVFFLVNLESEIRHNNDSVSLQYSDLLNQNLKNVIYYDASLTEIEESVKKTLQFMESNELPTNINTPIVKKHLAIFYNKSASIFKTIEIIKKVDIADKLHELEILFFKVVDHERETRKFINVLIALFFFLMLVGFLITFFKTFRDREKILQLQLENEQKNNEIVENMQLLNEYKKALDESSIVSKTDLHGNITYVNDKFCEISGYVREDLIGKPHNIIRHGDMQKEIFYELWQTIKNKKVFHKIIKNRKKDGGFYYVDSTIMPLLNINGEILEYFAVRHDVTELIKAKEDALAAEKAKSAFLATMSHELRTPLNAVIGFSQILLSKSDIPAQTLKDYLDKINISGKHLLTLINNILDFSKIESKKMEINKEIVILDDFMNNTLPLVETSAGAKNIKIEQHNFKDKTIFADEQLLKQVIINILSNAIKFTPEEKTITLSYDSKETFNVISICDEGIGLTKEQIATIFLPFSQIQEHQNKSIKGTGLGLAISQKIVELHNGHIEVKSEIGLGSCFNIYLAKLGEE